MERILLVEDDRIMRMAIGNILNNNGYNVSTAVDGREALAMVENDIYDLVITDLMLPHANGLEVVNKLRCDRHNKDVGIIVMSSVGNEETITEAFNLGADEYIRKPILSGVLITLIRKTINDHHFSSSHQHN